MSKLKQIEAGSVHRICAGQVVYDLGACMKELVENALDAGATSIEVRLKEYGSELIEVADNGSGIASHDYQSATLKHFTSKLSDFTDLEGLDTLGFRGEALSSLCALADVSIVTRTADDSVGTRLEYDHDGAITSQATAARAVGTTVAVKDIFKPLPVRHQEMQRNVRRSFSKLVTLLQAYALISKGVRFFCSNQSGSGARTTVMSTSGQQEIREHVVSLFGSKVANGLRPIDEQLGPDVRVCGLLSSASSSASGRSNGDRQFFFMNGRPVEMPKVVRLMNEAYKSLSSSTASSAKPMAVLNWLVPTARVDVNLTPDKRKFFLHDEGSLIKAFQKVIQGLWDPSLTVFQSPGGLLPSKRYSSGSESSFASNKRHLSSQALQDIAKSASGDDDKCLGTVLEAGSAPISHQAPSTPPLTRAPGNGPSQHFAAFGRSANRSASSTDSGSKRDDIGSVAINTPARRRSTVGMTGLECFAIGGADFSPKTPRATSQSSSAQTVLPFRRLERKEDLLPPFLHPSEVPPLSPISENTAEAAGLSLPQVEDATRELRAQGPSSDTDDVHVISPGRGAIASAERRQLIDLPSVAIEAASATTESASAVTEALWDKEPIQAAMPWDDDDNVGFLGPGAAPDHLISLPETSGPHKRPAPAPKVICIEWSVECIIQDLQGILASKPATEPSSFFNFKAATLQEQEGGEEEDDKDASEAEDRATAELDRAFQHTDFLDMQVIGQFNLGFIIARLGSDLWIIDQHAADEKYNFERLQATTVLNRQPLLCPLDMGLSLTEDLALREHLGTFEKNGFAFSEGPQGRLQLKAVPFSQSITFGRDDARELLACLEGGTGAAMAVGPTSQKGNTLSESVVRPSRVRAMLASRACRSSIMVGRALDRLQMRRVLDHLSHLKSPWKCPHGRPTLKHLSRLSL